MTLILNRVSYSAAGTFGVLSMQTINGNIPVCVTLEDPWLDNKSFNSCIPSGDYVCKLVRSPKFADVFEVTNVPGRDHILVHRGNTIADTSGCILIGDRFQNNGIGNSTGAFFTLMKKLEPFPEFELVIKDPA